MVEFVHITRGVCTSPDSIELSNNSALGANVNCKIPVYFDCLMHLSKFGSIERQWKK